MDKVTETLESDLLQLIQEHIADESGDEPGTITSGELAEAGGMSQRKATALLKEMAAADLLVPAMVRRVNAWGHTTHRQGYRLLV